MGRNPRDWFRLFCARIKNHLRTGRAGVEARLERQLMIYISETPFDNIESSHQYVSLLADAIEEARREVEEEIALSMTEGESADRRKEALQIVAYNLDKVSL